MNIQHIESLNDLVARITGVVVRERIPDRILEEADEVIVVDVTPETLEERLLAGKIYAPLGKWLLAANNFVVPWQTIVLSVLIYVGLPLIAGIYSRHWIFKHKGRAWFESRFLHYLSPVAITALLLTLILLFAFKGDLIVSNPLHIFLIFFYGFFICKSIFCWELFNIFLISIFIRVFRTNLSFFFFFSGFMVRDSICISGISRNSSASKRYCSQTRLRRIPEQLTGLTEWVRSP